MVDTTTPAAPEARTVSEAQEFASEIIDAFAALHPSVTMTWMEWQDLAEMIERQWRGGAVAAEDLVMDPQYLAGRRR